MTEFVYGTRTFREVSTLTSEGGGVFTGNIDAEWTIGGKPNGGYLLSMLARAGAGVSEHTEVIAASAHYLHSPDPGEVRIEAELLRGGRSASQVRSRMSQDGRPCVEALLTLSRLDSGSPDFWSKGLPEPGLAPYELCTRLVPRLDGMRIAIMEQVEVRLEPGSLEAFEGRSGGKGEIRGWLSLPGDENFDSFSLLYAVDSFPPATLDIGRAGWVPTLELTAYVRAVPVAGPVWVFQKAQLIRENKVDESCFVWDRTGRLVAQATQLAGIRLG